MLIIVGLTGKTGSGKDEAARIIRVAYPVQRVAFADQLKRFAATVLDVDPAVFFDPTQKDIVHPKLGKTHRQLLQEFGAKMREIDSAVWIHWADTHTQALLAHGMGIAFTDVRYANEGAYIKGLGGIIIEIERPDAQHPDPATRSHPSENYTGIVDATIINNGSLDQFRAQVLSLMELWCGHPPKEEAHHVTVPA